MDITRLIPLKEGEEIIEEARQSFLAYFWHLVIALIFLLVPFFFMFPLFRYGSFGRIVFFVLLLIGVILLIRTLVIWYFNLLMVSNQRALILERHGFFDKSVKQASFDLVNEVSFRQKGIGPTLFHYGNIFVAIRGVAEVLVLKNIKEPQRVYQLMVEQQRFYQKNTIGLQPVPPAVQSGPLVGDRVDELDIEKMIKIHGLENVEARLRAYKAQKQAATNEAIDAFLNGSDGDEQDRAEKQ